jgi:ATP-dependent Clp protease ATP-binding subunit ClpB
LDDGRLTDNKGITVDFSNTIIILTSNIASAKIMEAKEGDNLDELVMPDLKAAFKPEFLNRLDDIVIFNALGKEEIKAIVDIFFNEIAQKVQQRNIEISLSEDAKEYIAQAGFDPVYGARPLKRALYEIVEDRLAELILEDKVKEGSKVVFDVKDNEVITQIS